MKFNNTICLESCFQARIQEIEPRKGCEPGAKSFLRVRPLILPAKDKGEEMEQSELALRNPETEEWTDGG